MRRNKRRRRRSRSLHLRRSRRRRPMLLNHHTEKHSENCDLGLCILLYVHHRMHLWPNMCGTAEIEGVKRARRCLNAWLTCCKQRHIRFARKEAGGVGFVHVSWLAYTSTHMYVHLWQPACDVLAGTRNAEDHNIFAASNNWPTPDKLSNIHTPYARLLERTLKVCCRVQRCSWGWDSEWSGAVCLRLLMLWQRRRRRRRFRLGLGHAVA